MTPENGPDGHRSYREGHPGRSRTTDPTTTRNRRGPGTPTTTTGPLCKGRVSTCLGPSTFWKNRRPSLTGSPHPSNESEGVGAIGVDILRRSLELEDQSHSQSALLSALVSTYLPSSVVALTRVGRRNSTSSVWCAGSLGSRYYPLVPVRLTPVRVDLPDDRPRTHCRWDGTTGSIGLSTAKEKEVESVLRLS